jgi:hypothetical protein
MRSRWIWVIVGELAAIAVFTGPSLFYATNAPAFVVGTQILVGGLLIGCGSQGIDLLAVRVLLAFSAVLVITELDHTAVNRVSCAGFGECARLTVLFGSGLVLVSFIFGLVVVPVTMIWNRGFRSMAPEFEWRRLTTRQWVLVVVVGLSLLVALYLLLDIPAN